MPENYNDYRQFSQLDFYAILGISSGATTSEIKKNYISLSLRYHPDKLGRTATADELDRYVTIKDAYEVLIDPEKRKAYDRNRIRSYNPAPTVDLNNLNLSSADTHLAARPRPEPRNSVAIMSQITEAVFAKDLARLKEILPEYMNLQLSAEEHAGNIEHFNWLLRNSARVTTNGPETLSISNQISLTLIEFGADVNHYGEIIRNSGEDLFKCYFVEMLMYFNNPSLFKLIEAQGRFDYKIFLISDLNVHNIDNKFINLSDCTIEACLLRRDDPKMQREYQKLYQNIQERLLLLVMFCHWLVKNNGDVVLEKIANLEPKDLESFDAHTGEYARLLNEDYFKNKFRLIVSRKYSSKYVATLFQRSLRYGAVTAPANYLQYIVDILTFNCTVVISANDIDPSDTLRIYGTLLEAHDFTITHMLKRLQWHHNHGFALRLLLATMLIVGTIILATAQNMASIIVGTIFFAPLNVCVLAPAALTITKPLFLCMYGVHYNQNEAILSAYTNLLLADTARHPRLNEATRTQTLTFSNRHKYAPSDGFVDVELEEGNTVEYRGSRNMVSTI